ncbi:MAG TPA: MFS transporter [Streptosporangiaceae bacterium]|nr:MFS transporter [Streptosporangiaceae bacterium]
MRKVFSPGNQVTTAEAGAPATLAVAATGTALVLVCFTIPLVTLPSTAADLAAGTGEQAWILSSMSVGAAAGLLTSGAIGDDYGRRRTFLAGALVLAVSSLLAALASSALALIAARILAGLGGAAVLACSLGLIAHAFPAGRPRSRATGIWGASVGAGVAAGPLVAVGLAAIAGWRLPYLLAAVAAAVLAVAGRLLLSESRAARSRRADLAGAALLGLGVTAFLAGLIEGRAGFARPAVLVLLAVGAVLVAGFVLVERRVASPMLDLGLFRRADFTGATIGALASGAGVLSLLSLLPTVLERAMGDSALVAGAVLLAWSGLSVLTAIAAHWLPASASPRVRLVAGLIGVAAGQVALAGLGSASPVWRLLPGLLLAGAGNGILNAALGTQAVASVPSDRAAMGSGANNTARYLGSALGITVVAVILARGGAAAGAAGLVSGWNVAALVTAAFSLAGALAVLIARDRDPVGGPGRADAETYATAGVRAGT